MRTRRLFLVTLALVTVLAVIDGYAGSPSMGWGWEGFVTTGQRQMLGGEAAASVSGNLSEPFEDREILLVTNPRGSLRVTGEDRTDVAVEYTLWVYAGSEEEALAYARQVQVVARPEGVRLVLEVIEPDRRPEAIADLAVEYRIAMPRGGRVELSNSFGAVEVEGVAGPSQVENRYAETIVRRVAGDWVIASSFASLRVAGVEGSLHVDGGYGSGEVRQVQGPVTGSFEFGLLTVADVGSLDVKSAYGGIQASRIRGPARLDLSFSPASIEGVAQDLQVEGRFADVDVSLDPGAPGFRIEAESREGQISNQIPGFQGQRVTKSGGTSRFQAALGDGSRIIRIAVQNGSVTLR